MNPDKLKIELKAVNLGITGVNELYLDENDVIRLLPIIEDYALTARIDELETLQTNHSRTYSQTVTDAAGNVYVDDSHGYISKYETQERIK